MREFLSSLRWAALMFGYAFAGIAVLSAFLIAMSCRTRCDIVSTLQSVALDPIWPAGAIALASLSFWIAGLGAAEKSTSFIAKAGWIIFGTVAGALAFGLLIGAFVGIDEWLGP